MNTTTGYVDPCTQQPMNQPPDSPDSSDADRSAGSALRVIIEQLPDGIVIVGPDHRVRFVNPAAASLFGRSSASLVGTEFGIPLANGTPPEVELVRPDGDLVVAEASLDYGGPAYKAVFIFEFRDGKIERETAYWSEPFPAPDWRAGWVEKMD